LDEPDLKFAALSYVWGDESIARDVTIEGHPRAVTTNLKSALRNFWRCYTENNVSVRERWIMAALCKPDGVTRLRRYLSSKACDLHHESDDDAETDSEDELVAESTSSKCIVKDKPFGSRITAAASRAQVGGGYLPIWVDALCINQDDSSGEKPAVTHDAGYLCKG